MAGLLTLYQFAPGFGHPPLHLYLVFTGVWLFGAAMLWRLPVFGAIGTALYGVILAFQLFAMHEARAQNVVLAVASLVGAALALAYLVARRRSA